MVKLTIRQKLIGYRKMLDLTQEDMAGLLKITRTTYSKKEKDPNLFTVEETNAIQNLFNNKLGDVPNIFF